MTKQEILEREIRSTRNQVVNGLDNRKHHPTFGYTKARLRADVNRLVGLIIAHRIVADEDCPPNPGVHIAPYALEQFEIDLRDLDASINAS